MGFIKLPSNSEKILLALAQSDNPTQILSGIYEGASSKTRRELDGIVKELKEYGYINAIWADNMPYIVTLNNSARTYGEQLAEYELQKGMQIPQETKVKTIIFISHRSTDKDIADMLMDFFSGTGISRDTIFCSSLPGNDVNEKISEEVKKALKESAVNIAILSNDYYQSAYCLNEAGVLWYEDVPVIPIALPEINSSNMYGFLNNDYKLRRLDSDTDVSYIYDTVSEAVSAYQSKVSIITRENNKLRARYSNYIKSREVPKAPSTTASTTAISEITTDDERIVLFYILKKNIRKVSMATIANWLNESEIYDVNLENAFDLLSSFDGGVVNNNTLEFGIAAFRQYSANSKNVLPELKKCVDNHTKLAVDTFKTIWTSESLDPALTLFVAYIVDERMRAFGDRWMAEGQIETIKQWEEKNTLDSVLSNNYGSCLEFFVQNSLVYASSWTSHGNPREYSLCPSLQNFLFNCPIEIKEELKRIKDDHYYNLPF